MKKPPPLARIVSVCVRGPTAKTLAANAGRVALLTAVIDAIAAAGWASLDAVVLPGSYLRLSRYLGHMNHAERCRAIKAEPFAAALFRLAGKLSARSPDALIVAGCDARSPHDGELCDNTCVAFSRSGIAGLARKIFTSDFDTRDCDRPIVPNADDFGSAERFVDLANGGRALLAACYDLFGLTEDQADPGQRSGYIRYIWDGRSVRTGDGRFRALRRDCLTAWHREFRRQRPTHALCAIHNFDRPGLDGYWQRHGIAAASAVLGGGLVVGAAHFGAALPRTPEHSPLAAVGLRTSYLKLGQRRPLRTLTPAGSMTVRTGHLAALVRLFDPRGE